MQQPSYAIYDDAMRNLALIAFVVLSACATRAPDATIVSRPLFGDLFGDLADGAPAPALAGAAPTAVATAPALLGGDGYTKFSLGSFKPTGDIDSLDTGYYGQVAFGGDVLPLISLEASIGYAHTTGPGNSDLSLVPLLVSGRLQVPITIVKVYGGVGIGGAFAKWDFGPVSDNEFLLAGTAFLGAEVGLGKLAVGLEYRYLKTDQTKDDFTIEGQCALLTLTLPF